MLRHSIYFITILDVIFRKFSQFLLDFIQNIDYYIILLLWGLVFLGVFSFFWTFFQKINSELKTSAFIARLFISFLIFYVIWMLSTILNIKMFAPLTSE